MEKLSIGIDSLLTAIGNINVGLFDQNGNIDESQGYKEDNIMTEAYQTLDARNLSCPMPVLKSKKALKELEINQVLEILATDPGSMADIPAWSRTTGQELISSEELGPKSFRFLVKRLK